WQATRLQKSVALLDRQRTSRAHGILSWLSVRPQTVAECSLTQTGYTLSSFVPPHLVEPLRWRQNRDSDLGMANCSERNQSTRS
ncbi:MAG: hypothetical protein WAK72_23720, partial [Pseudolabrys sp.]